MAHEALEIMGAAHRIGGCGTAGRGEIGGEIRDGMTKGFRLREPLPPEVDRNRTW